MVARIGRPGGGHLAAGRWRGCRHLPLLGRPWLRVDAVAAITITTRSTTSVAATPRAAATSTTTAVTTTALSFARAFAAASLSSTVARAPSGGASDTTARIHPPSPVHAAADFATARDRCLSGRGC